MIAGDQAMMYAKFVAAGLLGGSVVAASGQAQFNSEYAAWGNNDFSQCVVPTSIPLVSVAAGNLHSLGLTADALVVAWGSSAFGQCNVPADLTDAVQIAAGGWYQTYDQRGHSMALLRSGTVRAWGNNDYGQCDVPSGLSGVVQIVCGWAHSAARTADGSVVVWGAGSVYQGDPNWGQRKIPTDLGAVSTIDTKGCHMMALDANGAVRCWGRNENGQCNVPEKLGTVREIAAGSDHSVVLLDNGVVRCWGFNHSGQCNVPKGLPPARSVAASLYGTLAVLQDGSVVSWGLLAQPPEQLTPSERVVAGGYHAIAVSPRDCNSNGIADSMELLTDRAFDMDGDGLLDACDGGQSLPVIADITITQGSGSPVLPWPVCAAWDARTQVPEHLWDLWVSRVGHGGPWLNRAGIPAGNPFALKATLQEGVNTFYTRMELGLCDDALFSVNLWLDGSQQPLLSATNGTPISPFSGTIPDLMPGPGIPAAGAIATRVGPWTIRIAEFGVASSTDQVGPVTFEPSGAPDLQTRLVVEVLAACGGDVSRNGIVDGVDLAAVLGAWGTDGKGQFACDIDRSGIVDGADLAQVLNSWGPCP
jgi:alpha-tubulin suppressor-like RCC1 family protein